MPLRQTVDCRVLVGKKVVTEEGECLGRIKSIRLDPVGLRVEGIVVGTGVFAPDVYVDGCDVRLLREDAATVVAGGLELGVGKPVFDADGWWVGVVREVVRSEDEGLVGIRVGSERGAVEIGVESILSCQDRCVLKEPFERVGV